MTKVDDKTPLLESMVRALAQDAGVQLRIADKCAWSPNERCVYLDQGILDRVSLQAALGVAAHEISHELVTRYHHFRWPEDDPTPELTAQLFNAVEDTRCEAAIIPRFVGVEPWLEAAHHEVRVGQDPQMQHDIQSFLVAVASGPDRPIPAAASARVRAALERTVDARRRYRDCLPDLDIVPGGPGAAEALAVYVGDVAPDLAYDDTQPQTLRELEVRRWAHRALQIAVNEILPVARELFQDDAEQLAKQSARRKKSEQLALAEALAKLEALLAKHAAGHLDRIIRPRSATASDEPVGAPRSATPQDAPDVKGRPIRPRWGRPN